MFNQQSGVVKKFEVRCGLKEELSCKSSGYFETGI